MQVLGVKRKKRKEKKHVFRKWNVSSVWSTLILIYSVSPHLRVTKEILAVNAQRFFV